jgi:hypothetical protein
MIFFFVLLSFWSSNCKNSIQMLHPWLGQLVPLKIEAPMMRLNAGLHFYGCFQILILNGRWMTQRLVLPSKQRKRRRQWQRQQLLLQPVMRLKLMSPTTPLTSLQWLGF